MLAECSQMFSGSLTLAGFSQRVSVRQARSGGRCSLMASAVHPRARLALHRLWAWTDTGGLTAQRFSFANANRVEVQGH